MPSPSPEQSSVRVFGPELEPGHASGGLLKLWTHRRLQYSFVLRDLRPGAGSRAAFPPARGATRGPPARPRLWRTGLAACKRPSRHQYFTVHTSYLHTSTLVHSLSTRQDEERTEDNEGD